MYNKGNRKSERARRHGRLRAKLQGTAERPRLAVFRSHKHIYAQVINDELGHTLLAASSIELVKQQGIAKGCDIAAAHAVGENIARKALAAGIKSVVYDRGGFLYHGRIAALADKARESGLEF
ncbi:MAG: 50S ribosomal protein L18 [Cyanobacteria bacterium NC_groundwater_1444_Ag_S-0.65um_54_12]|nr:50S ribosomal protein L18 [Cyanobacteria bacterium NC_groundwater_1444_Ag_S-0.65um_54_12]